MPPLWKVELSEKASNDFDNIIRHTFESFGHHQALRYSNLISGTLTELSHSGPFHSLSRSRLELLDGIRSIAIQRLGKKARHILFFKALPETPDQTIVVVRILHESMDFTEHL